MGLFYNLPATLPGPFRGPSGASALLPARAILLAGIMKLPRARVWLHGVNDKSVLPHKSCGLQVKYHDCKLFIEPCF